MANTFKEVFFLSEEKLAKLKKDAKKHYELAKKQKHCIACKYYNYDPYVPGFVTYCGDCSKGLTCFFGIPVKQCEFWEVKDE